MRRQTNMFSYYDVTTNDNLIRISEFNKSYTKKSSLKWKQEKKCHFY